jgi:hypothetical protein
MGRARRVLVGATLTALILLALTAVPAQAHYTYIYHGSDFAAVSSNHLQVSVCDRENDNHRVYADLLHSNGSRTQVWDRFDSVCATMSFFTTIRQYRLCEEMVSCTAWKTA